MLPREYVMELRPTDRLQRWLFLGAVGPVLLVLALDAAVQGLSERQLGRDGIRSEARTLARLSASMAEAAVEFDDARSLKDLLGRVQSSPHFECAAVLRPDGELATWQGVEARRAELLAAARAAVPGEVVPLEGVVLAVAAIGPTGEGGRLMVGLSTRDAEETLSRHLLRGAAMDLAAVGIAVGVVALLVRAVRQRTRSLELQREMLRQTGRMARIGGWELRMPAGLFRLTEEASALLGIDPGRSHEVMKAMAMQHRALVQCLDTGAPFDIEVEVPVEGTPRWMRVQGEAERVGGRTVRVFGALQDITESRATREAALAASRSKSQFLANTSHEIRTPLNGIIGMTELALEGPLGLEQRGYLESVRQSARTMLAIVNDLLDVARIEAGKVTIEEVPVLLDDVLASATRALVADAQRKGLDLVFTLEPGVPLHRRADPLRLTQIVTNLVGNALKFTEQGEIEVRCSPGGAPDELRLAVRDTGIGIPRDRLDAIFEAFTQSDGTTTRRYGGTGLGLTIARELSRLMGGELRVESAEGQGSTFTSTLRLPVLEEAEQAPRPERSLLVIEPRETAAAALGAILSRLGVPHRRVLTLEEGLAVSSAAHGAGPDVVLFDAGLPNAMAARENFEGQGRAVVLLVPFGTTVTSGRALATPLCVKEVVAALSPAQPEVQPSATVPAPRRLLRVLLAEDNVINATLAQRLIERAGHAVTHVWNGQAAVDTASSGEFDLVLMDVQMPELDGLEATRRIRAEETTLGRHVPIYAMTANAMESDRTQCMAAGMDGFITKPIDLQHLRRLLDSLAVRGAA